MNDWHGRGMDYYPGAMGIVFALFWIAVIIAVVALVAWLLRGRHKGGYAAVPPGGYGHPAAPGAGPSPSAMAILDERFARGEIDMNEYVTRRGMLLGQPVASQQPAPPPAAADPAAPEGTAPPA